MKRIFDFLAILSLNYRDIFILIIAYAVFTIGGSLYWAAIPILSENIFQISIFNIGLIMASIGVIYLLTDGPIGILLDFIGYKKGAIIAVLFAGITAIISISQPSLPMFLVGIFFFALSWNVLTHAVSAYMLYVVPDEIEGKIYGTYGSIYALGGFIATFFISFIAVWGLKISGIFFLVTIILSLLLILFFVSPEKRKFDPNLWDGIKDYWREPSHFQRGVQAMKEFSPVSWVQAFDGFVGYVISSSIWFVIPLSLASFSNPFLPEGVALGIFEFAGIIFAAVGGYLADKFSKKKIFLTLLFVEALTMTALGFTSGFFLFLLLAFITSGLDDTLGVAIDSMMPEVDEKHDKDGTIYGFIGIFTDFGFVVGPIVSSLAFAQFGLKGVFLFLGLLLFADWTFGKILLKNYTGGRRVRRTAAKSEFYLGGMLISKAPQHKDSVI